MQKRELKRLYSSKKREKERIPPAQDTPTSSRYLGSLQGWPCVGPGPSSENHAVLFNKSSEVCSNDTFIVIEVSEGYFRQRY